MVVEVDFHSKIDVHSETARGVARKCLELIQTVTRSLEIPGDPLGDYYRGQIAACRIILEEVQPSPPITPPTDHKKDSINPRAINRAGY